MKSFNFTATSIEMNAVGEKGQINVFAKMDDEEYCATMQQISYEDYVDSTETPLLLEAIPTNRITEYLDGMGLQFEMDDKWEKITPQSEENTKEGEYLFRVEFGDVYTCFLRGGYHRYNLVDGLIFDFLCEDEVNRLKERTGCAPHITHRRYLYAF